MLKNGNDYNNRSCAVLYYHLTRCEFAETFVKIERDKNYSMLILTLEKFQFSAVTIIVQRSSKDWYKILYANQNFGFNTVGTVIKCLKKIVLDYWDYERQKAVSLKRSTSHIDVKISLCSDF